MVFVLGISGVCFLNLACSYAGTTPWSKTAYDKLVNSSNRQCVEEVSREIAVFDNIAFGLRLPLTNFLNNGQLVKVKAILDLEAGLGKLSYTFENQKHPLIIIVIYNV